MQSGCLINDLLVNCFFSFIAHHWLQSRNHRLIFHSFSFNPSICSITEYSHFLLKKMSSPSLHSYYHQANPGVPQPSNGDRVHPTSLPPFPTCCQSFCRLRLGKYSLDFFHVATQHFMLWPPSSSRLSLIMMWKVAWMGRVLKRNRNLTYSALIQRCFLNSEYHKEGKALPHLLTG